MKANISTVLVGSNVVLVPYRPEHVPKYHDWMLDEELRALTASEPLTLEEEYEMQGKWQLDEDKLTFIILSRHPLEGSIELPETPGTVSPEDERLSALPMVGDVNIFLHGTIPTTEESVIDEDEFHAEVEIMIAEPSYRRKGLAIEALQLMLGYATGKLQAFGLSNTTSIPTSPLNIPPNSLITKISETNIPSIKLFEKLGFAITKRVEVFQEIEMKFTKKYS
ncbi:N-acetyltransferase 9 [Psilocybe cubensis]|uniref:N-acetyltransferase domain-containing protein n=2 Tax=Psilocybe cubensis TaxID=181762 RepID=A0A8H7XU53_PSICU|nr:N-acetyltransferase 9 [Psilocybe cubensis]KAH9475804.1 N-acetyltransferase 9 [Psilocybe cubensis]